MGLNEYIDGAFLQFGKNSLDLEEYIKTCVWYKIRGVCVWPYFVKQAKNFLDKYQIEFDIQYQPRLIMVNNFPHGLGINALDKIIDYLGFGVNEIDHSLNISAVKDKQFYSILNELDTIVQITRMADTPDGLPGKVKLIIHSDMLTDDELRIIGLIAEQCGIAFIKNSSGVLGNPRSTIEELKRIEKQIPLLPIKIAGGIKTKSQALSLIDNGASILGISKFEPILEEQ